LKERTSGAIKFRQGKPVEAGVKAERAGCATLGVGGGPDPAAKAAAMAVLQAALRRYLLGGQ
jgi:hypothetical protein